MVIQTYMSTKSSNFITYNGTRLKCRFNALLADVIRSKKLLYETK